jgi:hypothetical protein
VIPLAGESRKARLGGLKDVRLAFVCVNKIGSHESLQPRRHHCPDNPVIIRIRSLFLLPALMTGLGLIPVESVTAQTFTNLHSFTALTCWPD